MTDSKTPKTKLNPSVLQMRLNADNRERFKAAILRDVFSRRSDEVYRGMAVLIDDLVAETWGSTPQARAANKRRAKTLKEQGKALSERGLVTTVSVGYTRERLRLNLGGQRLRLTFNAKPKAAPPVINFEDQFLRMTGETYRRHLGAEELTLPTGHKLTKRFWKIHDEANAIEEAAEELRMILNTLFGRAKTLGAAVDRWPTLADYAPSILSACRELTVNAATLDARLAALRDGRMSAAEAMKIEVTAEK